MAAQTGSMFVTYVETYNDFIKIWGRTNQTCSAYIEKQLKQLARDFLRLPGPNPKSIRKDMFCLAMADDCFYRARVISDVFSNSVVLFFIDYGSINTIELQNIRLITDPIENVISKMVPQADPFYLANIGARGGWSSATVNKIRRDLCFSECNYNIVYQIGNHKFIDISYGNDDYSNLLIRTGIGRHISVNDQSLLLKSMLKNFSQNTEPINKQYGSSFGNKFPPNEELTDGYLPSNRDPQKLSQVFSNPNMLDMNPNVQYEKQISSHVQSTVGNQSDKTVHNANSGVVIDSTVIEAFAKELKQHLIMDSQKPASCETTSHTYISQVLEVGTTYSVYISCVDDGPWSFSIQLVANEHELNKLMNDLASCELVPVKLPVILGYPCLAKSLKFESYCRGVVVNISHTGVKIFFVDFGSTEDLPLTSIFELPAEFFKIKTMSQKFALSGLQKIKPVDDLKKAFVEVVENELLLLHVTTLEGENLPTCELYLKNVNIKRLLNEKVRYNGQCEPIDFPQPGEIENVVVTWADGPHKFYVQLKKNENEIVNLKKELEECAANGENFITDEVIPGVLCLARYSVDNEWYRALIMSVNSKTSVTVFYIDYGNRETVNPSMLKKAPYGLIRQIHSQAIQCCLIGYEGMTSTQGTKNKLEDLVLEKELYMKVIATEKERLIVKLFDDNGDLSTALDGRQTSATTAIETVPEVKTTDTNKITDITTSSLNRNSDVQRSSTNFEEQKTDFKNSFQHTKSPRDDGKSEYQGWRGGRDTIMKKNKLIEGRRNTFSSKQFGFSQKERGRSNRDRYASDGTGRDQGSIKFNLGKGKQPTPVSVNERLKKAAEENKERGLKAERMIKCPVELENIVPHGDSFKKIQVSDGSVKDVIVTYFISPDEIYVQLLSTQEIFKQLMNDIQHYYFTKLPISDTPQVGDIVVAKFKEDQVLYRAIIIETSPLIVRYVDYGNEEITDMDRVWPMDKKFMELEAQSLKCSLTNISPNGCESWPTPNASIDKIFEHEKYSCTFIQCKDKVHEVELRILENGKDVRDELICAGYALELNTSSSTEEDISDLLHTMDLSLVKNETFHFYISHVIDTSDFYVVIECDVAKTIEEKIRSYMESEKLTNMDSSVINIKQLYLVKVQEQWHRAIVLRNIGQIANVHLIDSGKRIAVNINKIKSIPDDIAVYPPQAFRCSLYGNSKIPHDVIGKLKSCEENYFLGYIHDVLDNRLVCTLYYPDGSKLEFLENLNNAESKIYPLASLPILRQEIALVISHLNSWNEIFIQRKTDMPALEELNSVLLQFYNLGGDEYEEDPWKLCAAKSVADNCWYRAKILSFNNESVTVFYIDYGNTEDIPVQNLKKLESCLYELHELSKKVSLNIDDCMENEKEVSEILWKSIGEKECLGYFIKENDILRADFKIDGMFVAERIKSEVICDNVHVKEDKNFEEKTNSDKYLKEPEINEEETNNDVNIKKDENLEENTNSDINPKQDENLEENTNSDINPKQDENLEEMTNSDINPKQGKNLEEMTNNDTDVQQDEDIEENKDNDISSTKDENSKEKSTKVYVSYVTSPNAFWIHEERIGNDLHTMQQKIQDECAKGIVKKDIQVGDVVGGLFTDHIWYRMKVFDIKDEIIHAQFIDYGNFFEVNTFENDVIELSEEIINTPVFAGFCSLKGKWKKQAAAKFEDIITKSADSLTLVELEKGYPAIVDLVQNGYSVTELLKNEDLEDSDENFVYICHINSPNDFYIQKDSDKDMFEQIAMGLAVAEDFDNLTHIEKDKICCAQYAVDNMWYRTKILNKDGENITVNFIDFGNEAIVQTVKKLPQELEDVPPLAYNCGLIFGKFNDTWSESACNKFTEYANDSKLKVKDIVKGPSKSIVSLFTEEEDNINEILSALCEADGRIFVCVSHINSPNNFYLHKARDGNLQFITEKLKDGDTLENLKETEVGMRCASKRKNDSNWYRVEIKKIVGNEYEVFFLDFGDTCLSTDLRELPDDIRDMKPLAKWCTLNLPLNDIPEKITEDFINMSGEGDSIFRARIIQAGECSIVSLISDGRKLEEVLLLSYDTHPCESLYSRCGEVAFEKHEDSAFEDDFKITNETDEEIRFKTDAAGVNGGCCISDDEKMNRDSDLSDSDVNIANNIKYQFPEELDICQSEKEDSTEYMYTLQHSFDTSEEDIMN